MPQRSNLFQDVVTVLYRHMAGDAKVERSALLVHSATGRPREVDVVIRGRIAAHEVVVAVEACGRSRRADVEWVEQMIVKHAGLPTDKLVLVAESGFTDQAHDLAVLSGAVAVVPREFTGIESVESPMGAFRHFEMKGMVLHFDEVWLLAGSKERDTRMTGGIYGIFTTDGRYVGRPRMITRSIVDKYGDLFSAPEVALLTETASLRVGGRIYPPWDGFDCDFAMRLEFNGREEFVPILEIRFTGTVRVEVQPVSVKHRVVNQEPVGFTEFDVFGNPLSLIATDADDRAVNVTLRSQSSEIRFPEPWDQVGLERPLGEEVSVRLAKSGSHHIDVLLP